MLPKVLKNFNLFVNNQGYAGRVEEIILPRLQIVTEEFRLGGLDTPVQMDMGMEKLECELTLSEYDAGMISYFGFGDNKAISSPAIPLFFDSRQGESTPLNQGLIPMTLRGGLSDESNNRIVPVQVKTLGHMVELDFGQWQAGQNAPLKIRLALRRYELRIDDVLLIEIDVDQRVRKVAGVDQLTKF